MPNQICGSYTRLTFQIGLGPSHQRPPTVLFASRVLVETAVLLGEGEEEGECISIDSRRGERVEVWR